MKKIDTLEKLKKLNSAYRNLKLVDKYTRWTISTYDRISGGKATPVLENAQKIIDKKISHKLDPHIDRFEKWIAKTKLGQLLENTASGIENSFDKLGAKKLEAKLHDAADKILNPLEALGKKIDGEVRKIPGAVKSVSEKLKSSKNKKSQEKIE
jgi:hypothetical protein